jgi:hypothetical protein
MLITQREGELGGEGELFFGFSLYYVFCLSACKNNGFLLESFFGDKFNKLNKRILWVGKLLCSGIKPKLS